MCGETMHLSKGAISLLYFYSTQASGFRPSLKSIANTIGRDRRNIERARKQLIDLGICSLQNNKLFIDWERLRLFSTLDPKLTSRNASVAPVMPRTGIVASLEKSYKQSNLLDLPLNDLTNLLNLLSDSEWATFKRFMHSH